MIPDTINFVINYFKNNTNAHLCNHNLCIINNINIKDDNLFYTHRCLYTKLHILKHKTN